MSGRKPDGADERRQRRSCRRKVTDAKVACDEGAAVLYLSGRYHERRKPLPYTGESRTRDYGEASRLDFRPCDPYYVIDAPGGGGKIPMLPNYVVSHDEKNWVLRNYKYDIYTYPDVVEEEKPTKAPARKRPVRAPRAPRKKKVFNKSDSGPELH